MQSNFDESKPTLRDYAIRFNNEGQYFLYCRSNLVTEKELLSAPGIIAAQSDSERPPLNPAYAIFKIAFNPLYEPQKAAEVAFKEWLNSRVEALKTQSDIPHPIEHYVDGIYYRKFDADTLSKQGAFADDIPLYIYWYASLVKLGHFLAKQAYHYEFENPNSEKPYTINHYGEIFIADQDRCIHQWDILDPVKPCTICGKRRKIDPDDLMNLDISNPLAFTDQLPTLKPINAVQVLIFELMKLGSFNEFDGEQVVKDLLEWRDLWDSCLMTDEYQGNGLILRDIEGEEYTVNTLYIKTDEVKAVKLMEKIGRHQQISVYDPNVDNDDPDFIQCWTADEVEIVTDPGKMLGSYTKPELVVIRVWWD